MSEVRDTRDHSILPHCGGAKTARIALGLELLMVHARRGVELTIYDIAAWCGCTHQQIHLIEKRALKKLANRLRFGPPAWRELRRA